MRLFFVLVVSALAMSAAEQQPAKKAATDSPKTATKAAKKTAPKSASKPGVNKPAAKVTDASKPMAIPAEAKQDATGDFLYTDAQGKKWIYRKTPFGVTRLEDNAERSAAKVSPAAGAGIAAFEDGDNVRFERKGPFGVWKWEKKKSEMDESERAALQAAQANRQNASQKD